MGERLAIVLDGELYTRSRHQVERIRANGEISGGNMDINEAITIANVLENPLETPVTIDEMREVDPTLGKDSIASGIRAAIYRHLLRGRFHGPLLSPLRHHRRPGHGL